MSYPGNSGLVVDLHNSLVPIEALSTTPIKALIGDADPVGAAAHAARAQRLHVVSGVIQRAQSYDLEPPPVHTHTYVHFRMYIYIQILYIHREAFMYTHIQSRKRESGNRFRAYVCIHVCIYTYTHMSVSISIFA